LFDSAAVTAVDQSSHTVVCEERQLVDDIEAMRISAYEQFLQVIFGLHLALAFM